MKNLKLFSIPFKCVTELIVFERIIKKSSYIPIYINFFVHYHYSVKKYSQESSPNHYNLPITVFFHYIVFTVFFHINLSTVYC